MTTVIQLTRFSGLLSIVFAATVTAAEPIELPQVWASSGTRYDDTDSLAACPLADGRVRLFATSKKGHRIECFDAATGRFERALGKSGDGAGEFQRPNGIAAVDLAAADAKTDPKRSRWCILVVERDNARIQAIWPESLKSAGIFARGELTRPYGASVSYARDGTATLFITETRVAPQQTVRAYRLALKEDEVSGRLLRSFGDADGPGRIETAESILVDDREGRLLVCDEGPKQKNVKVYGLDGRFTGQTFADGLIKGDPEGLVVLDSPGDGCVILTDQQPTISIWHLFDRKTLKHIAAFTGRPRIANTDGVCLYPHPFGPFKGGAFFAVHDDLDVRAYDAAEIGRLIVK